MRADERDNGEERGMMEEGRAGGEEQREQWRGEEGCGEKGRDDGEGEVYEHKYMAS